MKKFIIFGIACFYQLSIFCQSGNVGVGTSTPQAKLHISGDARIDDKLEIKNENGETVFVLNPSTYTLDILDSDGNVFYSVGEVQDTSSNLIKGTSSQNRSMPSPPRIHVSKDANGVTKTTTRRADGTIESVVESTGAGKFETLFHEDGTTPSQTQAYFPGFGFVANKFFNTAGDLTHEEEIGMNGSYVEIYYHPDGQTIKEKLEYDDSNSDKVTKENFDENGNRTYKEVFENGMTSFFNNDNEVIATMETANLYTYKMISPLTGTIMEYNALECTFDNPLENKMTKLEAGNVHVEEANKFLDVKNMGFEAHDPNVDLDFFVDAFGISKFEGPSFIGLDFNATSESADVFGDFNVFGMISKSGGSFKIDHPLDPQNKYLYHSFVESPDMMNIYNGNIITDKEGEAIVDLPNYFNALNIDYRYQLTVIGSFAQAIIWKKVENNQFVIKTDQPNVEVSWQVTGIRNDTFAKDNRIQNEVNKQGKDKGRLMYDPNRNKPYSEHMNAKWTHKRISKK
ncbi:MAG: hypothetical protein P1U56_06135 [Saprospiraceae bacterium]|nr:hypothetical protein [Saprospiraceae bacterium]